MKHLCTARLFAVAPRSRHDEQNTAGIGDLVLIAETRPLSASKRWASWRFWRRLEAFPQNHLLENMPFPHNWGRGHCYTLR